MYCIVIVILPLGGSPVSLRLSYHNYSLSECGAKVLESNKEAKVSYRTYISGFFMYMYMYKSVLGLYLHACYYIISVSFC